MKLGLGWIIYFLIAGVWDCSGEEGDVIIFNRAARIVAALQPGCEEMKRE